MHYLMVSTPHEGESEECSNANKDQMRTCRGKGETKHKGVA